MNEYSSYSLPKCNLFFPLKFVIDIYIYKWWKMIWTIRVIRVSRHKWKRFKKWTKQKDSNLYDGWKCYEKRNFTRTEIVIMFYVMDKWEILTVKRHLAFVSMHSACDCHLHGSSANIVFPASIRSSLSLA